MREVSWKTTVHKGIKGTIFLALLQIYMNLRTIIQDPIFNNAAVPYIQKHLIHQVIFQTQGM
jgi:hypothetical protein